MTTRDYCISLHVAIYFIQSIEEMSIVELFGKAKRLQQSAAAKVGEEIKVITIDHDESHDELDANVDYVFEDSNSRPGNKEEFDEANDENQDCLEDCGQDLMR